jgi:4-hydroxybutyrate CoA-transferase
MTPMTSPAWATRGGTAAEAVAALPSGANVFLQGAAATPTPLVDALVARTDLTGVRVYHLHTIGTAPLFAPAVSPWLRSVSFFVGPDARVAVAEGRADFVPVFLSDIPALFTGGAVPLDVALVQLSPPDRHGLCSLGTSCDAARAAVDSARVVIAEINAQMPRTLGNTMVPLDRVAAFVCTDRPLPRHEPEAPSPVIDRIGELVAELVEDGATCRPASARSPTRCWRGSATTPSSASTPRCSPTAGAAGRGRRHHQPRQGGPPRPLGHSFVMGTRRLYDFVDDNPPSSSTAATAPTTPR